MKKPRPAITKTKAPAMNGLGNVALRIDTIHFWVVLRALKARKYEVEVTIEEVAKLVSAAGRSSGNGQNL